MKEGIYMQNKNLLCCLNDVPLFFYSPIIERQDYLEQTIINYVTEKPKNDTWFQTERRFIDGVEFFYYEINIINAKKLITARKKSKYNTMEYNCLELLKFFLENK